MQKQQKVHTHAQQTEREYRLRYFLHDLSNKASIVTDQNNSDTKGNRD